MIENGPKHPDDQKTKAQGEGAISRFLKKLGQSLNRETSTRSERKSVNGFSAEFSDEKRQILFFFTIDGKAENIQLHTITNEGKLSNDLGKIYGHIKALWERITAAQTLDNEDLGVSPEKLENVGVALNRILALNRLLQAIRAPLHQEIALQQTEDEDSSGNKQFRRVVVKSTLDLVVKAPTVSNTSRFIEPEKIEYEQVDSLASLDPASIKKTYDLTYEFLDGERVRFVEDTAGGKIIEIVDVHGERVRLDDVIAQELFFALMKRSYAPKALPIDLLLTSHAAALYKVGLYGHSHVADPWKVEKAKQVYNETSTERFGLRVRAAIQSIRDINLGKHFTVIYNEEPDPRFRKIELHLKFTQ